MRESVMLLKKKREDEKVGLYRTQSYNDLFDAIGSGNSKQVLTVLQNTKDPIGLMQKKDLQGLTPLRKAIALSQGEIAMILVTNGADASQKGALNKEALHEAARMGQRSLLAPLLSSAHISVNVQDKFGMTPLHNAVRGRHIKAVEWLLFAGAEVNTLNDHDDSPLSLVNAESDDETEKQIYKLLDEHRVKLDPLELQICSGYVGQKQINNMGDDGSIMIITSDMWPEQSQFVFGIKILPDLSEPQFPLRQDELFYGYVFKYRMMYKLHESKRRVQIYFTLLEEFVHSELILKVCSKSKFIGEIPVTLTTYAQHKYINYLASCEMDLQNEGQFVLVKRPRISELVMDPDGIMSIPNVQLFKLAITKTIFPSAPAVWGKARRQREWDECQWLMANLPERENRRAAIDKNETAADETSNNNVVTTTQNKNSNAEEDGDEDQEDSEDECVMLDWSAPDTCEDFYYISRGWAPHVEYRRSMTMEVVTEKYSSEVEEPIVRAISDFFRIHHPSHVFHEKCMCQVPKTPQFVKVGTVLVFQRQELGPNEVEDPSPDCRRDEAFVSEDGRRTKGKVWLDKEAKRWSLIHSGVVNKPNRIVFNVDKLCTYVAVQLNIGEEKWELDSDDEDSDEEDDSEDGGGEEDGRQDEDDGDEEVKKKKKKKKQKGHTQSDSQLGQDGEDTSNNARSTMHAAHIARPTTADDEHLAITFYGGIEPSEEEFAIGLDKLSDDLKDGTSSEDLAPNVGWRKSHTISLNNMTSDGFVEYEFDAPRREDEFEEEQLNVMRTQIALNWRCRNHREAKVLVFTRHRTDLYFDMVVELVQHSDLVVRAETLWSDGYRMVGLSPTFLTLTGRLYMFALEGSLIIESPADGASRNLYFFSSNVNELSYVIKRKVQDEPIGPGKRLKKDKVDPVGLSHEIDGTLIVTTFANILYTEGVDILKLSIPLTGPNLWTDRHLQLRIPDNMLLDNVISVLKQDYSFSINWWKIWILLHFEEKQVEVEKVKQDWAGASELMLKRWFQQNIDANDRGISRLVYILDSLRIEVGHLKLLSELKTYKRKVMNEVVQPRHLDLLFHWAINTKITSEAFRRRTREPPVMSPLSDQFLMYLNDLLNVEDIFELGPPMEVEDNVLNSINGEENITDPRFKTFKVFMKSRQKKDEIVGFTLMLTEMVTALHQQEAYDFVVRETRRWMAAVIDSQPDTCSKLENLLRNLTKTHEAK